MLLAACLLLLASPTAAPDELAPSGTWRGPGGGPAGSGAAETPAPRGPVHDAWDVRLDGTLTREPLVEGDYVLVEEQLADGQHRLRVFDRVTGAELGRPFNLQRVAPETTLDRGLAVACGGDGDRLVFLRLGPSGLARVATKVLEQSVAHPVLIPEGLLVTLGGRLHLLARDTGRGRVLWASPLRSEGRPVVADGRAYVAVRSVAPTVHTLLDVVAVQLADGKELDRIETTVGADGVREVRLGLAPGLVALHTPRTEPLTIEGHALPTGALVRRDAGGLDGAEALHDGQFLSGLPTTLGKGFVAPCTVPDVGRLLGRFDDLFAARYVALATSKIHPAVLTAPRVTVAGGVMLVGGMAVDLASLRILWKSGHEPVLPPVPTRGRVLLVVDGGRRLVALGDAGVRAPRPCQLGADGEVTGQVVTARGELESAKLSLAGTTNPVVLGAKGAQEPLAGALAVLDAAGSPRWIASADAAARAASIVGARRAAEALVELSAEARKVGDAELLAELIESALSRGADERALAPAVKTLEGLEKTPRKAKADKVAELRAKVAATSSVPGATLWSWAEALAAVGTREATEARFVLLDELLAIDPGHVDAAAAVRALLPAGTKPVEPFDAREWLAFARASHETPVQLVHPLERESADLSFAQIQLGRAQHTWRKDLVAFESEQLVILATATRPGALARCLSLASLTCDALQDLFAEHGKETRIERKLVVRLYGTREEYKAESEKVGLPPGMLEWSGGFYSPADNVSRLFIPDGDAELDETLRTIVHEITHHWLQARCPLWSSQELAQRSPLSAGYWIVEGFAGFVEEWPFDTTSRMWETLDPRARRLDIVANTPEAGGLPWKVEFEISQMGFHRGKFTGEVAIPVGWALGALRPVDAREAFYCQAAAACSYLFHADDGAHRSKLIECLRAYYTGAPVYDVAAALGLSPEALGARIVAFARESSGAVPRAR